MLSFLSMILSSGTVLRSDSEEWSSKTYPDPRLNFTQCRTWSESTLCDPDHILTDQWRMDINSNINLQNKLLKNASVLRYESEAEGCHHNSTEEPKIYVILAKRIHSQANQTTDDAALASFGDEIAREYDLESQLCRNFIMLVGVGDAKRVYIRAGQDLQLPNDFMSDTFERYGDLFNAKNYMEGLNKVITEIAQRIIEYFKLLQVKSSTSQTIDATTATSGTETTAVQTTVASPSFTFVYSVCSSIHDRILTALWWIYAAVSICVFFATCTFITVLIGHLQSYKRSSPGAGEVAEVSAVQQHGLSNQPLISAVKERILKMLKNCANFIRIRRKFLLLLKFNEL